MASLLVAAPTRAQSPTITVTLVGTGGPEYFPDRAGVATLVEANGQHLLFDAGQGVGQRLYESRFNPKDIRQIFLTHLHSDHYDGLPELWLTPWFLLGRDHGFDLYGPAGIGDVVAGMRRMFAHDLKARVNAFNRPRNLAIALHPLHEGIVFAQAGVTVTAFRVEHGDGNPAWGFRVDCGGHAVLLSGDTTYDANVVRYGVGADVIIHNVIAFSPTLAARPEMQGVLAKLTTPEQAAKVFAADHPKLAVYSHIVTKDIAAHDVDATLIARTRAGGYAGPLLVGRDRMVISIGDTVRVIPPAPLADLPALDSKGQRFP